MNTILHIRKNVIEVSQTTLAAIAGTNQATVSRWERGELFPNLEQMRAIRSAVLDSGGDWDDRWFFEVPDAGVSETAA